MTSGKKNPKITRKKKPRNDIEGAQASISRPNQKPLTRKLIYCLKVSLRKVGRGLQGKWKKRRGSIMCILGSNCATHLWCVLEQAVSLVHQLKKKRI